MKKGDTPLVAKQGAQLPLGPETQFLGAGQRPVQMRRFGHIEPPSHPSEILPVWAVLPRTRPLGSRCRRG